MRKVAIIIVNWNTGKLLAECLQALQGLPEKDLISRVVVVDNNSEDDSLRQAQKITQSWDTVRWKRMDSNFGFAAANNLGIKMCREEGNEQSDILLLNPDTRMKPGCLKALGQVLDDKPKAGVVGPKLLNQDGSLQLSVREFPGLILLLGVWFKLPWLYPSWPAWRQYLKLDFDYTKQQVVDQVMGAVFMVRREVWNKLNGLDENFWIWFEEVDFCKRVQKEGFEIWYTPDGETVHYGGASFNQLLGLAKSKPWIKSSRYYAKKHLGWLAGIILDILSPLALVLSLVSSPKHLREKKLNTKKLC